MRPDPLADDQQDTACEMLYERLRTYILQLSIGHDRAHRLIMYQDTTYCGWFFYHTSSCTMLCYHRRYVYEYEQNKTNTLAATYEYAAV